MVNRKRQKPDGKTDIKRAAGYVQSEVADTLYAQK